MLISCPAQVVLLPPVESELASADPNPRHRRYPSKRSLAVLNFRAFDRFASLIASFWQDRYFHSNSVDLEL